MSLFVSGATGYTYKDNREPEFSNHTPMSSIYMPLALSVNVLVNVPGNVPPSSTGNADFTGQVSMKHLIF